MTHVTIERAKLEQVLEALEKHGVAPKDWACKECVPFSDILKDGFQCKYHKAITTCQQALEQPVQEPVAWIDSVMDQAQIFASAWSLVGGRFDSGNGLKDAEQAKAELRAMLTTPPAPAPVPEGMVLLPKRMTQAMRDVTDTEDWRWEDLLAAAEAITEGEYNEIAAAQPAPADTDLMACWVEKPDGTIDGIASMRLALSKYGAAAQPAHLAQVVRAHIQDLRACLPTLREHKLSDTAAEVEKAANELEAAAAQPAQAEVTVPDDMSHAGEIKIKIAPDGDIHITASGKDTWTGNDATVVIELTASGGRDGAKWHSIFRAAMLTATTPPSQPAVPDLTHDQWDEWQNKHGLILEREALDELRSMLYTTPPTQPAPVWRYWKVKDRCVVTGPFTTTSKEEAYGPDCIDATPLTVPAAQPAAPLTDLGTLQAIVDEYYAWIRHHAAGHDYDDFLRNRGITAAAPEKGQP